MFLYIFRTFARDANTGSVSTCKVSPAASSGRVQCRTSGCLSLERVAYYSTSHKFKCNDMQLEGSDTCLSREHGHDLFLVLPAQGGHGFLIECLHPRSHSVRHHRTYSLNASKKKGQRTHSERCSLVVFLVPVYTFLHSKNQKIARTTRHCLWQVCKSYHERPTPALAWLVSLGKAYSLKSLFPMTGNLMRIDAPNCQF
jgi:hypothetical protein